MFLDWGNHPAMIAIHICSSRMNDRFLVLHLRLHSPYEVAVVERIWQGMSTVRTSLTTQLRSNLTPELYTPKRRVAGLQMLAA